ncbi:hypothetical protein [Actinophytocola sp.]|uniref:hypothetical protein n=1 Tax=Actinophytocola sp. TaxID=1872138 RepID=UPI00389AEA23
MARDGDQVEHFLVDGVAPPVIGVGPPESPFDLEPDPEPVPEGRHRIPVPPTGPPRRDPDSGHAERQEPPTTPIPALAPQAPEKRKSWVARVFRSSGG